jgi:uncharacterized protein YkwD
VSPAGEARPSKPPAVRSAVAAGVLTKLNAIRVSHNLAPLVLNAQLTAAATQHSKEMLAHGYFDHASLDGTPPLTRIKKYYRKGQVGENLVWFVPDVSAAQAVNKWMSNALHRDVILDPRWRAIGISALHAAKAPGKYRGLPVTVITTDFGA